MIAKCSNCKPHPYQDRAYGNKMRVMNLCGKNGDNMRCTVCKSEKGVGIYIPVKRSKSKK